MTNLTRRAVLLGTLGAVATLGFIGTSRPRNYPRRSPTAEDNSVTRGATITEKKGDLLTYVCDFTDDKGVKGFEIYVNGTPIARQDNISKETPKQEHTENIPLDTKRNIYRIGDNSLEIKTWDYEGETSRHKQTLYLTNPHLNSGDI